MVKPAIVVTGAASDLGAALAEALSGPHRVLCLLGGHRAGLERVAEACRAKGSECIVGAIDGLDRQGMSHFIADLNRQHPIDLLVAHAGDIAGQQVAQGVESGEQASRVLRINLLSTIERIHMVLPDMLRRRQGRILIVASLAGLVALPGAPAFSASQAGLVLFGLALRDAVASQGIRVVVACPGFKTVPRNGNLAGGRQRGLPLPVAASRILQGLERNRSLIGFPAWLLWLGRGYLLMPQFLRRSVIKRVICYTS
jgi:short-subunit dehydrogenase